MWSSVQRRRRPSERRRRGANGWQIGNNRWRTGERYTTCHYVVFYPWWAATGPEFLLTVALKGEQQIDKMLICLSGDCDRGRAIASVVSHHHQADPGSGWGDQDPSCSSAQEPGDKFKASPSGRWVWHQGFFTMHETDLSTATTAVNVICWFMLCYVSLTTQSKI